MGSTRFIILYLVMCEWLLGVLLGFYVLFCLALFLKDQTVLSLLVAFILLALAATCFVTGHGLYRQVRWSWFASLAIGLVMASDGLFAVWASNEPMPNARGEEGWVFLGGVASLLPSVLGLVLLNLPHVRRYVLQGEISPAASPHS
jgi:hypothetical protein